jgi:hypothetical protein
VTALPPQPTAPSWTLPIAVGAAFTFVFSFASSQTPLPAGCCCCVTLPLPLGVLPAMIALRRDAALTPAQGFAVSFIAVGLGAALLALLSVALAQGVNLTEMELELRRTFDELNRAQGGGLSQEQIERSVGIAMRLAPYGPAIVAAVLSVVAGVTGLLTVAILRRRSPPPALPAAQP